MQSASSARRYRAVFVVVLSCATWQCANQQAPTCFAVEPVDHTGEGRIYDKELGISLVPPEGWEKTNPPDRSVKMLYMGKAKNGMPCSFNVVIEDDDPDVPLESLDKVMKEEMPKILPNWKLIRSGTTTLSGRPAFFSVSTMSYQGVDIKQFQVILRGDQKKRYNVTYSTTLDTYDELERILRNSAKTIRVD